MYYDAAKSASVVGWPRTPKNAYQRIAEDASVYKQAGFDAALFMPSTLGASGEYSAGYDIKDNYTFDGTSWGDQAEAIAAIKSLHAHGMSAYGDLVLHQMDGYPHQQYTTAKFPKTPACFAKIPGQPSYPGNVEPDPVFDPSDGPPDGDLVAYCQPDRYMWNGGIAAVINQIDTLGFDGFRIDEAKGMNVGFLCALIDSVRGHYPNQVFVGEVYTGNPSELGGWVGYWMNYRASVLDFMFKFNVSNICNNNSRVNMAQLSDIGYNMQDSMHAVTFLENADTDLSPGEQLVWNKQLGYDLMFSLPGEPMVYYRDWASDENCYGLTAGINNGLWRWANLAQGAFVTRHADYQTFVCERMGYGSAPGCVCFFNNDQWNAHTVTVQTRYPRGTRLHEYTGHAGYSADIWTDYWGCVTVTIPRNVNGLNSLVYGVYL